MIIFVKRGAEYIVEREKSWNCKDAEVDNNDLLKRYKVARAMLHMVVQGML